MTGMDILKNQNLLYCLFKISVLSTMLWFAKISSKHENSMFWVNLACVHLPWHSFFSKSNHQKCLFHPFFTNEVEYAAMPAHHVVTAAGHTSAINVVPGRYWHHKYFSPPLPVMHFRDCCRLPPLHRQASCAMSVHTVILWWKVMTARDPLLWSLLQRPGHEPHTLPWPRVALPCQHCSQMFIFPTLAALPVPMFRFYCDQI